MCYKGVVFVAGIFSINSCDNLCIYYFGSVSCIQCIVIKPPSKLINFPLTKVTIRVIESLGHFKLFLDDLFTFFKTNAMLVCHVYLLEFSRMKKFRDEK